MIIKVKSNYGLHQAGRVLLKTPDSPPFEVDDGKGAELLARGIAVQAEESSGLSGSGIPGGSLSGSGAGRTPAGGAPQGDGPTFEELRAMAKAAGIPKYSKMKKEELISALSLADNPEEQKASLAIPAGTGDREKAAAESRREEEDGAPDGEPDDDSGEDTDEDADHGPPADAPVFNTEGNVL